MAPITWDNVGDRVYQTGVDRGALYLPDGTVVAWNGLTSVEETPTSALTSYYFDSVKMYDEITPGDFSGKLKAYTYPEELESVLGIVSSNGFHLHDQPQKSFSLSYRTRVANDVDGMDHGYKLHVLYDLMINPDSFVYATKASSLAPIEFSWSISGTPQAASAHRPTVHVSIDSTETDPDTLLSIENSLYGTLSTDPVLLSASDIATLFGVTL